MLRNVLKQIIHNFSIRNLIFVMLLLVMGVVSFLGYLHCNANGDILILIFAYINPFFSVVAAIGQVLGIILCSIFYNQFSFLQTNFNVSSVVSIMVFRMFIIFMYSIFFRKILHTFSFKNIVKLFIFICTFTVILEFILSLILPILIHPSIANTSFEEKINIFRNYLPAMKSYIWNYKLDTLQDLVSDFYWGVGSMYLSINLFIHSSLASFFLSIMSRDPLSSHFNKFSRFHIEIHGIYKLLVASLLFITFIFWYLNLNFLALLSYSFFISLLFLFFLVGQEIIISMIFSLTNNRFILFIAMPLLVRIIPMFIPMLIILGIVESIFNIRNKYN